ncbi:MAG: DNA polymerase I [Clostridia bacterium]|nr:DNA polymerase I [Clostridia bacterium]
MKLMVLDGNSIVNRAFYGIRMLNAPDGTPTNAVYGFLAILQRLLEEEKPDGLCVAFDLKAPTFRHRQYAGYKAQRKPMPEELALQMPLLKEVLDAMGIRRIELEGYEADDLLGTMCRIGEQAGDDCVIVTGDKDSFQLISPHTCVLHVKSRMGQTETIRYTPERFSEEYGFDPIRMIDLKALMGDASDNIPGVPGIGEKTAMELLHKYGSLDGVYAALPAADIKPGVLKKLTEGADSARMSYSLATIVRDAPVSFDPEATRWNKNWQPGLYELFRRLGFQKFIEKWNLSPTQEQAGDQPVFTGSCTMQELLTADDARRAAEALRRGGTVDVAFEADFSRMVFQRDAEEDPAVAYVLERGLYSGDWDEALRLLFDPALPKAGHGVKPLLCELLKHDVPAEGWVFDSKPAAYLLEPAAGSYELDDICVKYCHFRPAPSAGDPGEAQLSLLDEPEDRAVRRAYLAARGAAVACLEEALSARLRDEGMWELYQTVELPLLPVLARMQAAGMAVDRQRLLDFGVVLDGQLREYEAAVHRLAGHDFNIGSPKQLGTVLFEELGLKAGKKTRTGYSTDAETLEKLKNAHPIIPAILSWRKVSKLKSTYVEGLSKVIGPDGRIHSTFHQTVTATGRLSSADPNLQNIPIRREDGSEIRKCFVPRPGWVFVDADYSQIELRILAHMADDKAMQEAFASGEDFHAVTASQVFGVPLEQVDHRLRSAAKAVNFGIVYGISAWSLADDIHVSTKEAQDYIDAYLARYHGVRDFMEATKRQAAEDGYVTTLYGRRRWLPELKSANFQLRSFGQRAAMNAPIQGTAADIIKLAMVRVDGRLRREKLQSRLILQVHDELILEVPKDELERACAVLKEEMEGAAALKTKLVADVGWGETWYDAKK